MSILNAVHMDKFSLDRSLMDCSRKIWDVECSPVELKWLCLPEDGILFTSEESN